MRERRRPEGLLRIWDGGLLGALLADDRIRYLIAGGIAALVYLAVFSILWLLLRGLVLYSVVAVISQALTAVTVYPLYRTMVFLVRGPWLRGLVRFYLVCAMSFGFSIACLLVLVEIAGLPVMVAQVITIAGSPLIAYPMQRHWAFRRKPDARRGKEVERVRLGEGKVGRLG